MTLESFFGTCSWWPPIAKYGGAETSGIKSLSFFLTNVLRLPRIDAHLGTGMRGKEQELPLRVSFT